MSQRTSVVIIGGGHNGLVCAAYLARAGLSVVLLEQKYTVGGCVVTEEVAPGWRVNTYSFEHYVTQNMPMHVDMSDNQMFENGPAPGLLNGYEVDSISNFHLCGAGTFPGGAVTGIPGRNAANQILRQISPSS